jgi:hypothetical protein
MNEQDETTDDAMRARILSLTEDAMIYFVTQYGERTGDRWTFALTLDKVTKAHKDAGQVLGYGLEICHNDVVPGQITCVLVVEPKAHLLMRALLQNHPPKGEA